jgi:hypothetical protein
VKQETPAADELRASIERTRAEMRAAAQDEDFGRAHALQGQLEALAKQLAGATGAASSSSGPADLEDVAEAQLRAKRALDEVVRASAIDLAGPDDEAAPSGTRVTRARSGLPTPPIPAPGSTSKKLKVSSPSSESDTSVSDSSRSSSPANLPAGLLPAGPLPAVAAKCHELPETCGSYRRGDNLEIADGCWRKEKTAVLAGHVVFRLRAASPPSMLPQSGKFSTHCSPSPSYATWAQ